MLKVTVTGCNSVHSHMQQISRNFTQLRQSTCAYLWRNLRHMRCASGLTQLRKVSWNRLLDFNPATFDRVVAVSFTAQFSLDILTALLNYQGCVGVHDLFLPVSFTSCSRWVDIGVQFTMRSHWIKCCHSAENLQDLKKKLKLCEHGVRFISG